MVVIAPKRADLTASNARVEREPTRGAEAPEKAAGGRKTEPKKAQVKRNTK